MQEYSKIRTFLMQRKNNAPLLPESGLRAYRPEFIMIPAVAYQVCLTKSDVLDNVVTRTVVDLAKYYERNGLAPGEVLDTVSERTKLARPLVKAILRQYENKLDAESGEENDRTTQEFYYVLYDPIMKRCYPDLIPAQDYEKNARFEETKPQYVDLNRKTERFSFKLSMSDSRRYSVHVLNAAVNDADIPKDPKDIYSSGIVNRYLRNAKSRLDYLGISETVGLICPCFLSRSDLSKIHVMSQKGNETMDQLMESIRASIHAFPELNSELDGCMREMDKIRKTLLDRVETFIDAKDETKKRVLINFPDLCQYPNILEDTAKLEAIYKSYVNMSDAANDMDPGSLNETGRDFIIAFYTLLEKVFAVSVVKNYPRDRISEMEKLTAPLQTQRDHVPYFVGIAEQAGLDDTDTAAGFFRSPEGKVRIKTLNDILRASFSGGKFPDSLPELVVAHFIQAAVSEDHPFRSAIMKCPSLLQTAKRYLPIRNAAKHGNAIKEVNGFVMERREINEMLVLVESMIDVLLAPRASFDEAERNEEDINNRQNARIKAEEEMKAYSALSDGREAEVCGTAKRVCYRFYYKDPEYFSECSNLLSVLLDVLIREFTVRSQLVAASNWFDGNKLSDDGRIHALFGKYHCDYESDDKPDTAKISAWIRDPFKMTLKCKFYLAVVVLDKEKPAFLKKLLSQVPALPKLIDTVCIYRGHSKPADFSGQSDGYLSFHKECLEICNAFYEVLKGGE